MLSLNKKVVPHILMNRFTSLTVGRYEVRIYGVPDLLDYSRLFLQRCLRKNAIRYFHIKLHFGDNKVGALAFFKHILIFHFDWVTAVPVNRNRDLPKGLIRKIMRDYLELESDPFVELWNKYK